MVALIVLVLGVLGAAAMTLTALRDSKQSALRSQASALAFELAELMRMSPDQEAVFTGAVPASVGTCWTATGCAPIDMARNNYYEWDAKLRGSTGLPGAAAKICRDVTNLTSDASGFASCDNLATSPLVVKLRWDEKANVSRFAANATIAAAPVTQAYLVVPIQPF